LIAETGEQRRAFIQANRNSILSHIKRQSERTNGDPETILASITAGVSRLRALARHHHLVSWSGTGDDGDNRVPICLLKDPSAVDTRDRAVTFFEKHQDQYPTLDTAVPWVEYGESLADLADLMSGQETIRFGIPFNPAPRPPTEVKDRADLDELNEVIVELESRLEDVMLVVSTRCLNRKT